MEAGTTRGNGDAGNQSWTLSGEVRHERGQVKSSRRQREAPGEVKNPKRRIIRVESEEAQDYARELNEMDQEAAEEMSFVPRPTSVSQTPLFRCDNQCSENDSTSCSWRRW